MRKSKFLFIISFRDNFCLLDRSLISVFLFPAIYSRYLKMINEQQQTSMETSCVGVTRAEFEELKATIDVLKKTLPNRLSTLETRVERNERHRRGRKVVICNVPTNENDDDLPALLQRLWHEGYYYSLLLIFAIISSFSAGLKCRPTMHRYSMSIIAIVVAVATRHPPKVYVAFVRREELQSLMQNIGNLKGYKGAYGRNIFVERDTTAEGRMERRVALFVRKALLLKYAVEKLPTPSIRIVEGKIKVFSVLNNL